jgi:hypothetical protein
LLLACPHASCKRSRVLGHCWPAIQVLASNGLQIPCGWQQQVLADGMASLCCQWQQRYLPAGGFTRDWAAGTLCCRWLCCATICTPASSRISIHLAAQAVLCHSMRHRESIVPACCGHCLHTWHVCCLQLQDAPRSMWTLLCPFVTLQERPRNMCDTALCSCILFMSGCFG